jgi:hypothetical protein
VPADELGGFVKLPWFSHVVRLLSDKRTSCRTWEGRHASVQEEALLIVETLSQRAKQKSPILTFPGLIDSVVVNADDAGLMTVFQGMSSEAEARSAMIANDALLTRVVGCLSIKGSIRYPGVYLLGTLVTTCSPAECCKLYEHSGLMDTVTSCCSDASRRLRHQGRIYREDVKVGLQFLRRMSNQGTMVEKMVHSEKIMSALLHGLTCPDDDAVTLALGMLKNIVFYSREARTTVSGNWPIIENLLLTFDRPELENNRLRVQMLSRICFDEEAWTGPLSSATAKSDEKSLYDRPVP